MVAKNVNPLVKRLLETLKRKEISISQFAEDVDIKKDRVYKWEKQGTNPKAEDVSKIELWLTGGKVDKVPRETEPASKPEPDKLLLLMETMTHLMKTQNSILADQKRDLLENVQETKNKVSTIEISLNTALDGLGMLAVQLHSGRQVVLQSLSRLEKKPADFLLQEADKIMLQKMSEKRQTGNPAKKGNQGKG